MGPSRSKIGILCRRHRWAVAGIAIARPRRPRLVGWGERGMTQAAQDITLFDSNQAMTAALVADARAVLSAAGPCSLLLSGGSSPCDFYTALGQEEMNWGDIHIALVDERWVDEDDAGSNAALVKRSLMAGRA
ncbi:MAG TPA: hypothetical protein DHW86_01740, partial [Rhodobiaceae bacterium]|nr:hypothetical protein [Rhodobiaceae bacterium]